MNRDIVVFIIVVLLVHWELKSIHEIKCCACIHVCQRGEPKDQQEHYYHIKLSCTLNKFACQLSST